MDDAEMVFLYSIHYSNKMGIKPLFTQRYGLFFFVTDFLLHIIVIKYVRTHLSLILFVLSPALIGTLHIKAFKNYSFKIQATESLGITVS